MTEREILEAAPDAADGDAGHGEALGVAHASQHLPHLLGRGGEAGAGGGVDRRR